jgi:ketosteroid isomerase-like protein
MENIQNSLSRRHLLSLGASTTVISILINRMTTAQTVTPMWQKFNLPYIQLLFATIDQMKVEEFVAFFAEDGQFRFGNADTLFGKQAIRDAITEFFSSIQGLSHDITGVWKGEWDLGDVVSVEANVTYIRQDGQVVTLPATSTLRFKGNLIQDYRIFMDISPVFA